MTGLVAIPSDPVIRAFWDWFATTAPELASSLDNPELLRALDERVGLLGDVGWELGPGQREPRALVITPDGKKEWLAATRYIVKLAPAIAGWELHPAKPPKTWDLRLSIAAVSYDARPWRYVLYEFPDGTFDIIVEQNNVTAETPSYLAAAIVVDGMVGEDVRLEVFGDIEPVIVLPAEVAGKATPIPRLADHVRTLLRSRN